MTATQSNPTPAQPETKQPTAEMLKEAREIFGKHAVSLALEIVALCDPDGAFTMLEDEGEEDAAAAVEFLFFE